MADAPLKDVLLVGFGAVGAIYSLVLKRSDLARVTVVARSNYEIVTREGINFNSVKYGNIKGWKPDRLCRSVSEAADRSYDYVLVATKAIPELSPTPKLLAPFLSPEYVGKFKQPTYVLLQNGLNVEVDLYHATKALGQGEPKIVSAAVWIGTNLASPNVVEHGNFDRLNIGIYRHNIRTTTTNTSEEQAVLDDIGRLLSVGGSDLTIVTEIQRQKFAKNFWNVAFSSYTTLTRYTVPSLFRAPPTEATGPYKPYVASITAASIEKYTIPAIKAVLNELVTLGRALGYPDDADGVPRSLPDTVIELTKNIHVLPNSSHKPSMLLDAELGQPLEVEVILGEVVRLAQQIGVDVPRIETLYSLLLVVQNQILGQSEADQ